MNCIHTGEYYRTTYSKLTSDDDRIFDLNDCDLAFQCKFRVNKVRGPFTGRFITFGGTTITKQHINFLLLCKNMNKI